MLYGLCIEEIYLYYYGFIALKWIGVGFFAPILFYVFDGAYSGGHKSYGCYGDLIDWCALVFNDGALCRVKIQ